MPNKCCEIKAGDLRHRVTLQRMESVPDGQGGWTKDWATFAEPRIMLEPLSGRERREADRLDNPVRYRAVMRYRDDVEPAHRIVYRGRAYNIRALYDMDMRRRWLELELEQGVAA